MHEWDHRLEPVGAQALEARAEEIDVAACHRRESIHACEASVSAGIVAAMRIAVGSDHAGFELKELVRPVLEEGGHEVVDVGTDSEESTDYPRHAADAARMVAAGEAERAVIVCGSGVGVSIVANKVDGVRAVNAHDAEEAEMSRRHNDANVLALAGRRLSPEEARPIVETFLETEFEGGRHERRVDQIAAVERGDSL